MIRPDVDEGRCDTCSGHDSHPLPGEVPGAMVIIRAECQTVISVPDTLLPRHPLACRIWGFCGICCRKAISICIVASFRTAHGGSGRSRG